LYLIILKNLTFKKYNVQVTREYITVFVFLTCALGPCLTFSLVFKTN
jgi:hypothetical protein